MPPLPGEFLRVVVLVVVVLLVVVVVVLMVPVGLWWRQPQGVPSNDDYEDGEDD
jgi:hypothetical protein